MSLITKQATHIISFGPISKRPESNSFHELSMTSVSIDVIGLFWRATKRKLYGIVRTRLPKHPAGRSVKFKLL